MENEEFCRCIDDFAENLKPNANTFLSAKIYTINFGNVAINTVKYKTSVILTPKNVPERCEYNIMKDTKINPVYQAFNLNHYNGLTRPKAEIKVKIKFEPQIPFQSFMEKFTVWFDRCAVAQVICKGFCAAPIVKPDKTNLYFYKSRTNCSFESLSLRNESEVAAVYQFEVDDRQEIFHIQKQTFGEISGNTNQKFLFNFKPSKYGVYAMQITCLICYHEPIIINLFGIYSETDYTKNQLTFNTFPLPEKNTSGYNGYFNNIQNIKTYVPPISLSRHIIHCGLVPCKENENNYSTETYSLTNHMNNGVRVEWLTDSKVFIIYPQNISIPPKESMTFECRFQPSKSNTVYKKMLRCQIFWKYDEEPNNITVPLTENITVFGHSCLDKDVLNIAKLNIIPPIIKLPPCIPSQKVATTFRLENPGRFPVIFKFIPPKNTNFIIHPQFGVVTDQTLIAIQFCTSSEDRKSYIEQWPLVLNDDCEQFIPVYIKVECSKPNITIGNDDMVFYEPMQINTHSQKNVSMYNNTIYKIRFKFNNDNQDFFESEPKEGILDPYDDILINFKYKAKNCSKSKFIETIELQNDDQVEPRQIFVQEFKVSAEKTHSTLFAQPSYFEIDNIKCGLPIELKFCLFNYGESTVHYKIYISERKCYTHLDYAPDFFTIDPYKESIAPGEQKTITVTAKASSVGRNYVKISYLNRIDETSDEIANLTLVELVQLTYTCVYPTIMFTELLEHNFGLLFSHNHVWNMLNIDKINQSLDTCRINETKTIESYLPNMPCSQEEYQIILIAAALSQPKEDIEIKRNKNCDCKIETTSTQTRWIKKYNCPHRLVASMDIINQDDTEIYTCILTIKYILPGENILSFFLSLSEGRKILINLHVFSIPLEKHIISSYTRNFDFKLKNIYIGDAEHTLQMFWLYNTNYEDIFYEFNTENMKDINSSEGFNVFDFLNPIGVIKAQSRCPLIIKFLPIQEKNYYVNIDGYLGEDATTLKIEGRGTNTKPNILDNAEKTLNYNTNDPVKNKIYLSTNFIKPDAFPSWNYIQHLILIRNCSEDTIYYYEFQDEILENIIEIKATTNCFGYLRPKQSQQVILTVKSHGQPIFADFLIKCKITNLCEKYLFEKNMQTYLKRLENNTAANDVTENKMSLADFENWKGVQPYYLNLQIFLHVIGSKDKDNYLNFETQLKYVKQSHINVDLNKDLNNPKYDLISRKNIDDENLDMFKKTTELLIADITFSKLFQGLLNLSAKQNPPIYENYRKCKKNCPPKKDLENSRINDAIQLFQKPSLADTAKTIENLLSDILKTKNNIENPKTLEECFETIETYVNKHAVCSADCYCKK